MPISSRANSVEAFYCPPPLALLGVINTSSVADMPVPLPPPTVEDEAANILASYDQLMEVNRQRVYILEDISRGLLKDALAGGRGLEDQAKLSDLIEFAKGRKSEISREIALANDVPILLIDVLRGGHPSYTTPENIALARASDTLMVMDGGSSCEIAIGYAGAVGSTLGKFQSISERLPPHILYRFLETKVAEFKTKNVGSAIPHANKAYILNEIVPLLPQREAQRLERHLQLIQAAICNLREQQRNLRETRNLLLPKLVIGEINSERDGANADRVLARVTAA